MYKTIDEIEPTALNQTLPEFPDIFNGESYRCLKFKILHIKDTWDRKLAEAKWSGSSERYNEAVVELKSNIKILTEMLEAKL